MCSPEHVVGVGNREEGGWRMYQSKFLITPQFGRVWDSCCFHQRLENPVLQWWKAALLIPVSNVSGSRKFPSLPRYCNILVCVLLQGHSNHSSCSGRVCHFCFILQWSFEPSLLTTQQFYNFWAPHIILRIARRTVSLHRIKQGTTIKKENECGSNATAFKSLNRATY